MTIKPPKTNRQRMDVMEQARLKGARKGLPMDGVSILQRWLDLNGITVKRLANYTGYSKEYIKNILRRTFPINRNFANALSEVTGIVPQFLMETQPYPHIQPEASKTDVTKGTRPAMARARQETDNQLRKQLAESIDSLNETAQAIAEAGRSAAGSNNMYDIPGTNEPSWLFGDE